MAVVIIAQIVFGIGLASFMVDVFRNPKPFKIFWAVLSVLVYGASIIWALQKFVN